MCVSFLVRLGGAGADERWVQATNMLYGEIDRLSAAWSTLDEQNSSKVFSLVGLEEKVQRLNTDVRVPPVEVERMSGC